jgi:hypothetical protein
LARDLKKKKKKKGQQKHILRNKNKAEEKDSVKTKANFTQGTSAFWYH